MKKLALFSALIISGVTGFAEAQYYGVPPGGHSTSENFIRTPTRIPSPIYQQQQLTPLYRGSQIPVPQSNRYGYERDYQNDDFLRSTDPYRDY